MKKIVAVLCLIFLVALSACNDAHNDSTENKESEKTSDEMDQIKDEGKDLDQKNEQQDDKATQDNEEEKSIDPTYYINDNWSIVPMKGETNEKVVLLTIDDAPDKHALEMAETLKKLDANAIFFVNGHFLETPEKQKILQQIHEMGFLIGNHTYNHPFLPDLTNAEQEEQIVGLNDLVEEIIGERPQFFRAPNGANTDYTKEIVEQEKMVLMNWTYGYDWEKDYRTKESITDIMINTESLNNGANLLMHDREWTAAALHDIVVGLREKGYEIVDPKLIQTK